MADFASGFNSGLGMVSNLASMYDRSQRRDEERSVREASRQASSEARSARDADIDNIMSQGLVQPQQEGGAQSWSIGGQTYTDQAQARRAAEGQAGSFFDYYMNTAAPRVMEQYLQNGDVANARTFQSWIQDAGVQRGIRDWAGAVRAAQTGDADGFARHMTRAYNNQSYFGDGNRIVGSRTLKGDDGSIEGMELTFRGQDGSERTQTYRGMQDLYRAGVSFMAPENVLKFAQTELAASRQTTAKLAETRRANAEWDRRQVVSEGRQVARESRAEARDERNDQRRSALRLDEQANASLLRQADEAAKRSGARPEEVRKSLETIIRRRAETDPAFGRLPPERQAEEAARAYEEQTRQASTVAGNAPSRAPQGVTVYTQSPGGVGIPR